MAPFSTFFLAGFLERLLFFLIFIYTGNSVSYIYIYNFLFQFNCGYDADTTTISSVPFLSVVIKLLLPIYIYRRHLVRYTSFKHHIFTVIPRTCYMFSALFLIIKALSFLISWFAKSSRTIGIGADNYFHSKIVSQQMMFKKRFSYILVPM